MNNKLILILVALFSFNAYAQTPVNAIDDAVGACEAFKFDKDDCIEAVNKSEFYQKSLVTLCSRLIGMDTDKVACLSAMGNKTANEKTVQICDKKTWWDETRKCVSSALKTYQAPAAATPTPSPTDTPPPTPAACNKEKAKLKLDTAMDQVKKFKYLDLYESLVELKYLLRDCGF